jgi:hypothetical protein
MSNMTEQKWRSMSDHERVRFLNQNVIEVESQGFLDSKKKVGDYSAFTTKYRAKIGGVIMSRWCDSEAEALHHGLDNRIKMTEELADEADN